MKLNYINQIKANISIYSNKKTTNILDGTYKSVYIGKSMNFENLREYVINDDVKDIDWKASSRSGTLLVKQFIADKKHNIMFIMDTGKKMSADTDLHESKKKVALFVAGTMGYLAIKNNDYVGMAFANPHKFEYKPFKYNLYNLEEYLCDYEKYADIKDVDLNDLLEFVYKNIAKKMIIFIITDINGIDSLKTNLLKQVNQRHDLLVVNINDNFMTGDDVYDVNNDNYIPDFILNDSKLYNIESQIKNNIIDKNLARLKRNNISMVSISGTKEISYKLIKLLEEHRYASNN